MRQLYSALKSAYPKIGVLHEAYEASSHASPMRKIMMREVIAGLSAPKRGYKPCQLETLAGAAGFTTDLAQELATIMYEGCHDVWLPPVGVYLVDESRGKVTGEKSRDADIADELDLI